MKGFFGERLSPSLVKLLTVALVVRLVVSPFTGHWFDLTCWFHSTKLTVEGVDIYQSPIWERTGSFGYPPAWIYVEIPFYLLWVLFFPTDVPLQPNHPLPPFPRSYSLVLLMKLPLIASDLLVGYLLYAIVFEYLRNHRAALVAASLWLLNPLVIMVSCVWGAFDSIPAGLTLAAAYALVKKRIDASAVLMGLAIAFKTCPIFLLIPISLVLARRSLRAAARYVLVSAVVAAAVSLPHMLWDFSSFARAMYISTMGRKEPLGASSLLLANHVLWFFGLSADVASIGYYAMPLAMVAAAFFSAFGEESFDKAVFRGCVATLFAFYLTSPAVHPQFFVWSVPFLIVDNRVWDRKIWYLAAVSAAGVGLMLYDLNSLFMPVICYKEVSDFFIKYWIPFKNDVVERRVSASLAALCLPFYLAYIGGEARLVKAPRIRELLPLLRGGGVVEEPLAQG